MITLESRNRPAQNHSALGPLRTRISLRAHTQEHLPVISTFVDPRKTS